MTAVRAIGFGAPPSGRAEAGVAVCMGSCRIIDARAGEVAGMRSDTSDLFMVESGAGASKVVLTKTGLIGIGTTDPLETIDLRGTSANNDVLYEKVGRVNGNTNWVTIFSVAAGAQPQAMALIDIATIYGTPSEIACRLTVMARGALTYSVVQTLGDSQNGCSAISFRWTSPTFPSSFQVSSNNGNVYYAIRAQLYSVGTNSNKWNHTWGTDW